LFQNAVGIVPGETDYQVYRDYGGESIEDIDLIPGIDMVTITRGEVYHTALDDAEHIAEGVMQRTGENVLSVLRALANSPMLASPGDTEHVSTPP
jgi:hypothetical protein